MTNSIFQYTEDGIVERKPKSTYDYPRPAYTADTVVFNNASVLLIRRGKEPFKCKLALPGGFVNEGESSLGAARRELQEETGLVIEHLPSLVGVYDTPGRDPRSWTVSIAYRIRTKQHSVKGADDATEAIWVPLNRLTSDLAFDHYKIIQDAWEQESKGI